MSTNRKKTFFLLFLMALSFRKNVLSSPTATFLRVSDGLASPTPSLELPGISVTDCGVECFKAGIDQCLGFQWKPDADSVENQNTNSLDYTEGSSSSSPNCTRSSLVGASSSVGRCGLFQCVPNPSFLTAVQGSQMYFFKGKTNLSYGSITAPPSYSMGCTYAYKVFDKTPMSYADAETQCSMDGAILMAVKRSSEQSLIVEKVSPGDGYWIGLDDREAEGTFLLSDGNTPEYQNWDNGQPNNFIKNQEEQDCVMLFQTKWNDNQCSTKLRFICQIIFLEL